MEEEKREIDLGKGSQVIYMEKLIEWGRGWELMDYLNTQIPWSRPTIRVFGRWCLQPRDTCYVATPGLPEYRYSGYKPRAYSWDDYPPLKLLLDAVEAALPGCRFNSLLLNRYKGGNDYVGWHSDDEKLYGPTPDIASLSFGCPREFLMKKRRPPPPKSSKGRRRCDEEEEEEEASSSRKRLKKSSSNVEERQSLMLKHGSLLVMKGYSQRDWLHSVPRRSKIDDDATRINLTFRRIL